MHTHRFGNTAPFGAGFTLIELLVSVAILTIITGIALANHSSFNSDVLLTNLGHEVALSIREAQTYGVAVREVNTRDSFDEGFGVYFSEDRPETYVLFEDRHDNRRYDSNNEARETFTLRSGSRIVRFCATPVSGSEQCHPGVLSELNIVFERPDPNPFFTTNVGTNYEAARIVLESTSGSQRTVTINTTGQIQVDRN